MKNKISSTRRNSRQVVSLCMSFMASEYLTLIRHTQYTQSVIEKLLGPCQHYENLNIVQVKSLNVTGAANTSLVVTVQSCNEYSFRVEFSQQSFWRSKIHQYQSGVTKFKTQGIPSVKPTFDWKASKSS